MTHTQKRARHFVWVWGAVAFVAAMNCGLVLTGRLGFQVSPFLVVGMALRLAYVEYRLAMADGSKLADRT